MSSANYAWRGEPSACQAGAVEGEAVERAEDGDGDLVGPEIALGKRLQLLGGDGFDGREDFVEREEASEIEVLAREIGHARTRGLEREHQRTLEVILRAAQLFFADQRFFERAKLLNGEIDDLANGIRGGAGIDRHHASIGGRCELAENRVGQAALFANVLEQPRRHAAPKEIIEDSKTETVQVSKRNRWNA